MSIRKLLAASRQSGPATVYEMEKDGVTIKSVTTRPARGPFTPGRLTKEESVLILISTGAWPETYPAAAWIGVQATDWDVGNDARLSKAEHGLVHDLRASGIMSGVADTGGED